MAQDGTSAQGRRRGGLRRMAPMLLAGLALAGASTLSRAQTLSTDGIYELRTYHVAPGKLDALNARFRDHTLKLFAKHHMQSVAYWNQEDTANGQVVYILAFPSRAARDAAWDAFRADPEWQAVAKASEADGKLVEKVDSVFMRMTDYSPHLKLAR
ncbi:NIPSNAP family protein [Phenylobacterium hankyongense]|nr:NIPSNAP family protein [Phenylobacterium hankyongense]